MRSGSSDAHSAGAANEGVSPVAPPHRAVRAWRWQSDRIIVAGTRQGDVKWGPSKHLATVPTDPSSATITSRMAEFFDQDLH